MKRLSAHDSRQSWLACLRRPHTFPANSSARTACAGWTHAPCIGAQTGVKVFEDHPAPRQGLDTGAARHCAAVQGQERGAGEPISVALKGQNDEPARRSVAFQSRVHAFALHRERACGQTTFHQQTGLFAEYQCEHAKPAFGRYQGTHDRKPADSRALKEHLCCCPPRRE